MKIRAGFTLAYQCPQPTQMLLVLDVHPSRRPDLLTDATVRFDPPVEPRGYIDGFVNACTRITAPAGTIRMSSEFLVHDSGRPDVVVWDAVQHDIKDLPDDVLVFLLGSRYCDTDRLGDFAWAKFSNTPTGSGRVQAIRDFAHLAITLCRCMNIPARYCTGYLGDIGIAPVPDPMDFSIWFQVYLGGNWYTFDARHSTPRIGRVLMATGREAADVALSTNF